MIRTHGKPICMLPPTIRSANDLITSHNATREGFLQQALAKTGKADPFIEEARTLYKVLQDVEDAGKLTTLSMTNIRLQNALFAAAGFSDKARSHMSSIELSSALGQVLERIFETASDGWRMEIVYRFLLTKGDTLGGSMRNYTGALGARLLSSSISESLRRHNIVPKVTHATNKPEKVIAMTWDKRHLVFDRKPRFIDKNIDAILLDISETSAKDYIDYPPAYLACGELKGGIDPAGADEHWKTASTAFNRIRERFTNLPALFFVGAAIQKAMAEEIFTQLQDGRLTYAANLTIPEQVPSLVDWLVRL